MEQCQALLVYCAVYIYRSGCSSMPPQLTHDEFALVVFDGDPAPPPAEKGAQPPSNFWPMTLVLGWCYFPSVGN